jgi:hypothetical protein
MKKRSFLRLAALASMSMTVMSAATFAQSSKPAGNETVIVPGLHPVPAGCSLQLLNSVPLEINNDQLTVPADVNGKTQSFLLDTAAMADQMSAVSARSIGLTPESPNYGGPQVTGMVGANPLSVAGGAGPSQEGSLSGSPNAPTAEIYDSRGRAYTTMVTVADFTMQAMEDKNIDFHVTPLPPPGVDGVLDLELFGRFDLDLNFAARSFNMFSKDHCRGEILYWRAPGVAALPFLTRDNRVYAHVMLDGKELIAIIDTGSPISALRFDVAAGQFGVTQNATTLVGEHHSDSRQDLYAYNFKTLSFGTVAIGNPHLLLTPNTILVQGANRNARTGSRVQNDADDSQPDMIIGMDILKLTHLYIAQGERVLYVTQGNELPEGAANAQPVVPVVPFRP